MADSRRRKLERQLAAGDPSALALLDREKERASECLACSKVPACPKLGDGDGAYPSCKSKLPDCEDCEGSGIDCQCVACDGVGCEDCDAHECGSCDRCEGTGKDPYGIVIDGDAHILEDSNHQGWDADLWELSSGGRGRHFIVAIDAETAGAAAKERWADMAQSDPNEFATMVGEQTLVAWALGQSASPGNVPVSSLAEWLDVVADHPEEEWAGYDGSERTVSEVGSALAEELGFTPTVAYRSN